MSVFVKLTKFLKSHFSKGYKTPLTFQGELNRQCNLIVVPAAIIILFSGFIYIPIDSKLHPELPIIVYLRLGCPVIGLAILAMRLIPYFKNKGNILLIILGVYLEFATAIITGATKGDSVYMGGFLFMIMASIIAPLRYYLLWIILCLSMIIFFTIGFINGMEFSSPRLRYSLNDLIATSIISFIFVYVLDKIRYNGYLKSRELEAEKNQLKQYNEIINKELAIARMIQENLIPKEYPSSNIFSLYKPMSQVGGDFFDFLKFRETNEIGIFVSDVSGHGVPAALITSMLKSFILQCGNIRYDPKEFLLYLNELLLFQTAGNFITAFYGVYNPESKTLRYANAGHNSPYILNKDNIEELGTEGKGVPLAILSNEELNMINKSYTNIVLQLDEGSRIVFYTDGLIETININNENGNDFGTEKFLKSLSELRNLPIEDFIHNLFLKLVHFRGSNEFEDDVCIICLDV